MRKRCVFVPSMYTTPLSINPPNLPASQYVLRIPILCSINFPVSNCLTSPIAKGEVGLTYFSSMTVRFV